jgi:hypothetical protein
MANATRALATLVAMVTVAGSSRPATAQDLTTQSTVPLRLKLVDETGVPGDVVAKAKDEVVGIYRDAGVEIVWDQTVHTTAIEDPPVRPLFVMIVPAKMSNAMAVNSTAMGVAVTSSKTRGRLVYIFYDRVEDVASLEKADTARVLGHAMAHEIGHLLLPAGHTPTGLMRGDWNREDFRELVRGRLLFTVDQAELIRTRLAGDRVTTK